jgi:putative transposase
VKKRYSEEQIIKFLKEADAGVPVKELCRRHGFSEASYYLWRSKFGSREREAEEAAGRGPARKRSDQGSPSKKVVTAPARREVVRIMKDRGMSERHALRVVGMSASALRYAPRPDGNAELRQQIVQMAQRHRRYGAPMIYLKLRHWKSCRCVGGDARRSRRRIGSR